MSDNNQEPLQPTPIPGLNLLDFDYEYILGKGMMEGKNISDITSAIIGENTFVFHRAGLYFKGIDEETYWIHQVSTGKSGFMKYKGGERFFMNLVAIAHYEKFLKEKEIEDLKNKFTELVAKYDERDRLIKEVHAQREQIDRNAEEAANLLLRQGGGDGA